MTKSDQGILGFIIIVVLVAGGLYFLGAKKQQEEALDECLEKASRWIASTEKIKVESDICFKRYDR